MKARARRLALALASALLLAACGKGADKPALPAPKPALWEVTAPDGSSRGWLFGTIHTLPDGTDWRTPKIEKAIAHAGLLVVEVKDLGDSGKLSATFTRLSHTAGLAPLSQRVDPKGRARLAELLAKGHYREADFSAVETWAAALMLAQVSEGGGGENGIDRALIDDFRARPVEELEGIEAQFSIFDRLPEADQRDLLQAVVDDDTMSEADDARLARMWLAGDMKAIAAEGDDGMLADPELKAALLTDRNAVWAERIAALYQTKARPLVAVGAAHMAPPGGLPELLAARGYKVRRVE